MAAALQRRPQLPASATVTCERPPVFATSKRPSAEQQPSRQLEVRLVIHLQLLCFFATNILSLFSLLPAVHGPAIGSRSGSMVDSISKFYSQIV